MIEPDYLTAQDAQQRGYEALTVGYELPQEQRMLEHVIDDMQRGNIDAALVAVAENSVEVWRKSSRVNPARN